MVFGVAYHSPLDIISLMPLDIKTTLEANVIADVFITNEIINNYNSRIQLVFSSARILYKANLPIIDHGPWGKIVNLTSNELNKVLGRYYNESKSTTERKITSQTRIPRWVRF